MVCGCTYWDLCEECEERYKYYDHNTFYPYLMIDFIPCVWVFFGIAIPLKTDVPRTGILFTHFTLQSKKTGKIIYRW